MPVATITILHGPNLNLLGTREPEVYGTTTLDDINTMLEHEAGKANIELVCHQSNSESRLIDWVHQSSDADFVIINPGAFTHTSIALRDALAATGVPFIEVHLSNIHAREPFRSKSWLADIAVGSVSGLGYHGYLYALNYAVNQINSK